MHRTQVLFIVIFTFISVVAWVATDIIFNTKPSIPTNPNLPSLLEDVNPNFDQEALNQISQKDDVPPLISIPTPLESQPIRESTESSDVSTNSANLR